MMLVLDGLTRYYGSFLALDHLSLTIHDGELHGFVGPNGAGKTTTMRILATLLKPTEGTAALDGVDVAGHPREIRRLMGYMPDFFGVYDRLKAWEYLDFYARCYGFGQKERRRMTDSLLELVNLTDKRDSYVDVLSRGMKQRLCLARALIHDPRLLILDEPASGMDPRARAEMKGILRTLKDMGKTVLISSHILSDLEKLCDYIAFLHQGQLLFCDEKDRLLEEYGIFVGTADQVNSLQDGAVVARENSSFGGVRCLVKRALVPAGWALERPTVEDIVLFLVKGAKEQ